MAKITQSWLQQVKEGQENEENLYDDETYDVEPEHMKHDIATNVDHNDNMASPTSAGHHTGTLASVMEEDIGNLLNTKIQVALDMKDNSILSNLNVKIQGDETTDTKAVKKKPIDLKNDYSHVSSKLYDVPTHMQGVGLKIVKDNKRKHLRQVMSQVMRLKVPDIVVTSQHDGGRSTLIGGIDLNNLSREEIGALHDMDVAMDNYARAIIAYRENGRIFYDDNNEKTDICKHPYYDMYVGKYAYPYTLD